MTGLKARILRSGVAGLCLASVGLGAPVVAQWTHRYPKVEGYRHHVYLEGYELPVLGVGPSDPAPSPDGRRLAFAARGWLWLLDLETREARRVTSGAGMDSRPVWSPDGRRLAFVRDDGADTDIWVLRLEKGKETALVDTAAIDLDPAFSADGRFLYYSSAQSGDLDLWRLDLRYRRRRRLTSEPGLELRPLPLADGNRLVYVAKRRNGPDRVVVLDLRDNSRQVLKTESIVSQTRPALSPDSRKLAVNWPGPEGWDLWLLDVETGDPNPIRLTRAARLPLTPAWRADGSRVFFVEAGENQRFQLYEVPAAGGDARPVSISSWNWEEPTGRLVIRTRVAGETQPVPARLHIADGKGHPALPDEGQARFDPRSGKVYVYSPGVLTVEVPAGDISVDAAHGFTSPALSSAAIVAAGETTPVELEFQPLWAPRAEGWYSGDHHFHLNYGGPYRLAPQDLLDMLRGEDLDVATPLVANLHHRFSDLEWWSWRRLGADAPLIAFGQEVRSHFLGHLGLIGIATPYWPWYWGPGYPVYGRDDRPNAEALQHARRQGGVNSYVHPVSVRDPFADDEALRAIPVDLVADAVLGDLDTLELACLWIDPLGTSEVWYRLLDLGLPVAPWAGTDSFPNFFRTMAVGTARIYTHLAGSLNLTEYLEALRGGRSFVTNGPLLDFTVEGRRPGEVITTGGARELSWKLTLASPVPVENVEVLLNGMVVWSAKGLSEPGRSDYSGSLRAPSGGWVASRVHGGSIDWPAMDSYPFGHTGPLWLNERGSIDGAASRRAASDLLEALDVSEERVAEGYQAVPIPRLRARFAAARRRLVQFVEGRPPSPKVR
ncbi:MAG: CehA/McbA family metallohydrolase [Acidobacteriota bacterium]